MNIKKFTIAYIAFVLVIYIAFAYVSLRMNPVSWDGAARALFAFLLIVGLPLFGIVTQDDE